MNRQCLLLFFDGTYNNPRPSDFHETLIRSSLVNCNPEPYLNASFKPRGVDLAYL